MGIIQYVNFSILLLSTQGKKLSHTSLRLFKNSFSGIFGDPVTNQLVLENGNIFRIATAFDEILSTQ